MAGPEWTYNEVNGEIVDVYLFQSEILDIPVSEQDVADSACYESLATHLAAEQEGEL